MESFLLASDWVPCLFAIIPALHVKLWLYPLIWFLNWQMVFNFFYIFWVIFHLRAFKCFNLISKKFDMNISFTTFLQNLNGWISVTSKFLNIRIWDRLSRTDFICNRLELLRHELQWRVEDMVSRCAVLQILDSSLDYCVLNRWQMTLISHMV
jgi:hypothetical protein